MVAASGLPGGGVSAAGRSLGAPQRPGTSPAAPAGGVPEPAAGGAHGRSAGKNSQAPHQPAGSWYQLITQLCCHGDGVLVFPGQGSGVTAGRSKKKR